MGQVCDAGGRPILLGDTVVTRNGKVRIGAVLEIGEDFNGPFLHLGDGITYSPDEVCNATDLEWEDCENCGTPWVRDLRKDDSCPFCDGNQET